MAANEERARLRTENAVLQERVHLLEEQFHSTEHRWKEKYEEEKSKAREMAQRMDRERQLEAEKEALRWVIPTLNEPVHRNLCKLRHQMLTNQVDQLERDKERSAAELREMREKARKLQDQLADAQQEAEKALEEQKTLRKEFEE